jgi:hypothetical protein
MTIEEECEKQTDIVDEEDLPQSGLGHCCRRNSSVRINRSIHTAKSTGHTFITQLLEHMDPFGLSASMQF